MRHCLIILFACSAPAAAQWTVTNLHPDGATSSGASGVHNGQQTGTVYFFGTGYRASLWSGTAASWVDLHPGSGDSSAFAIGAGQQVGQADVAGLTHASLWTGTAASWVDLHPPGVSGRSFAVDVSEGVQVGTVIPG